MLPETYIQEKQQLEENAEILKVLEKKEDINNYIIYLQKVFLEGIQEKIKKAQTRSDIMSIIYKLRYYLFLPYRNKQIKDIEELKEEIYKIENAIYNLACNMKVLNQISINPKVNIDVIRAILDISIVQLENIEILIKAENYQITIKIYDEDDIEKTLHYNTIEGLVARMNKKYRLFIK